MIQVAVETEEAQALAINLLQLQLAITATTATIATLEALGAPTSDYRTELADLESMAQIASAALERIHAEHVH